jgi:hypothetical protein
MSGPVYLGCVWKQGLGLSVRIGKDKEVPPRQCSVAQALVILGRRLYGDAGRRAQIAGLWLWLH